jgi:5-methylcytosine-specific restriction endonuclease McrA
MTEIRTCAICNKLLKYRQKFTCSHKCLGLYVTKTKNITFKCAYCGKDKTVSLYRYNSEKQRTCSVDCGNKLRLKNLKSIKKTFTCINCNKQFVRFPSMRRGKLAFCSRDCWQTWSANVHVFAGQNNPSWDGGKWEYQRYGGRFNFRDNQLLRQSVFSRDNYQCQDCHSLTKQLNIHHIDGNGHNNQISNLITLCAPCHMSLERKNKRKRC